jgi:hypothetical protein
MPAQDPRQQYGSAMRGRPQQDTEAMFRGAGSYTGGAQERMREVDFDPSKPMVQAGSPSLPSLTGVAGGIADVVPMSEGAAGALASGARAGDVLLGMYQFGRAASGTRGVLDGLRSGQPAPQSQGSTLSGSQPLYKAASNAKTMASFGEQIADLGPQGGDYNPASSIRPDQQEQWQQQRGAANMRSIPRGIASTAAAMFGYGPR